ncbi:MAG TPA: hypothetical protein DCL44_12090 [Elusimicrobia bacterium]|nr:hypothetical protein [Elusimicrobiota bacterium]
MGHASEELKRILEKMKGELVPEAPAPGTVVKKSREPVKRRPPAAAAPADKKSEKQELITKYESALRQKEAEHEKEIKILRVEFEQERRLLWGEIDELEMRTHLEGNHDSGGI